MYDIGDNEKNSNKKQKIKIVTISNNQQYLQQLIRSKSEEAISTFLIYSEMYIFSVYIICSIPRDSYVIAGKMLNKQIQMQLNDTEQINKNIIELEYELIKVQDNVQFLVLIDQLSYISNDIYYGDKAELLDSYINSQLYTIMAIADPTIINLRNNPVFLPSFTGCKHFTLPILYSKDINEWLVSTIFKKNYPDLFVKLQNSFNII